MSAGVFASRVQKFKVQSRFARSKLNGAQIPHAERVPVMQNGAQRSEASVFVLPHSTNLDKNRWILHRQDKKRVTLSFFRKNKKNTFPMLVRSRVLIEKYVSEKKKHGKTNAVASKSRKTLNLEPWTLNLEQRKYKLFNPQSVKVPFRGFRGKNLELWTKNQLTV